MDKYLVIPVNPVHFIPLISSTTYREKWKNLVGGEDISLAAVARPA